MYEYMYVSIYVRMCTCVYIYTYIHTLWAGGWYSDVLLPRRSGDRIPIRRDFQQVSKPALGSTQPRCTVSSGSLWGINSLWMSVWRLHHHKMPNRIHVRTFLGGKKNTFSVDILRMALLFSSSDLWLSRLMVLLLITALSSPFPNKLQKIDIALHLHTFRFTACNHPVTLISYLNAYVESIWNVMAHGDSREWKWRGNWRMQWVASILHTTSEHGVSSITTADAHTSAASSRLNWRPRLFKWTRPFRRKKKYGP